MPLNIKKLFLAVLLCGSLGSCFQKQPLQQLCTDDSFVSWDTLNTPLIAKNVEVLNIHISDEPISLHPTNSSSFLRTVFNQYLHRTLVTYDNDNQQLVPDLLLELPKQEGKTNRYAYRLKDTLFWDDGTAVTAADIQFTFLVNACPLVQNFHAKTYLNALEDIILDKYDNRKCVFVMKNTSLRNSGFTTGFPILQAKKWDPMGILQKFTFNAFAAPSFRSEIHPELVLWANEFNDISNGRNPQAITGLGKYTVSKWLEGNFIELKRKQTYHSGANRIVFKVIKDPTAVQLSFSKQEIDASFLLTQEEFAQLSSNNEIREHYKFACINNRLYYFLAMNTRPIESGRYPFFADKSVREALAWATPIDTIMQLLGSTQRMLGPVYADNPEYATSIPKMNYNRNKAKLLLAQAGWKDTDADGVLDKDKQPFSFVLLCSNSANQYKDIALLLAEFYREIGIEVQVKMISWATLHKQGKAHQFDMLLTGVAEDFLPQDFSELWHTQSWLNGGQNYSGFGNDTTDKIIDSIAEQHDLNTRILLSGQLQQHIRKQHPVIFLFKTKMYIAVHKRLGNVKIYSHRPYTYIDTWEAGLAN